MSGNSKQRRVFRRKLARQGMRYIPPSDWRRQYIDSTVWRELQPIVSGYRIDAATRLRSLLIEVSS